MPTVRSVVDVLRGRSFIDDAVSAARTIRSRFVLRDVDSRGHWTRVVGGRPNISNDGTMILGDKVRLICEFGPSDITVSRGATLSVGHGSVINYGTDICVAQSITLGERVSVGPRCIISDTEAPIGASVEGAGAPAPIVIENGVWLASRVTVMPGVHIGAGTVVTAGSVVDRDVPAGVVAGGAPFRVLRKLGADPDDSSHGEVDSINDVQPTLDDEHSTTHPDSPGVGTAAPAPPIEDDRPERTGLLISDFTIDLLATELERHHGDVHIRATVAPFDNVVPTLMSRPAATDFAVVWTRPSGALPVLGLLADGGTATAEDVRADVDRFAELIQTGLAAVGTVIVPTWSLPTNQRGRGVADMRPGGARWAVALANARLSERLGDVSNTVVVDTQRWIAQAGLDPLQSRHWYRGKVPFTDDVFRLAADDIADVVALASGARAPRKLLVVDLDDTLWGGIVGDVGTAGIRLGGHDPIGEAFVDFQHALRSLRRRGVLLAIASKNDEATAVRAIESREEMVLGCSDFVAWKIDWNDKAANIAAMVADLNLGFQSVVFIDDNPHERERVRDALPDVLVPEWPADPMEYVDALSRLTCFDQLAASDDDAHRTEMYIAEREREQIRTELGSLDDWIRALDVVASIEPLGDGNLARATQLLNKTNQMNLRTRRLGEHEFRSWASDPHHATACVRISDRIGEAGLTGLVSVAVDAHRAQLVDFVLSCRVMGRRIEDVLLHVAVQLARDLGASTLIAEYQATDKNAPCHRYFDQSPLTAIDAETYCWDGPTPVPAPDVLRIDWTSTAAQESVGGQS